MVIIEYGLKFSSCLCTSVVLITVFRNLMTILIRYLNCVATLDVFTLILPFTDRLVVTYRFPSTYRAIYTNSFLLTSLFCVANRSSLTNLFVVTVLNRMANLLVLTNLFNVTNALVIYDFTLS